VRFFPGSLVSIVAVLQRYNLRMASADKVRVLFVCIGNACRSPMAEAVARQLASDVIEPASAGLYPLGRLAPSTEDTLLANGYSVDGLASKALSRVVLEHTDVIVNISGQPLDDLLRGLCGGGFDDSLLQPKMENWDVEDPYGAHPATYQRILEELESKVLLLASRLRAGDPALNC
jgi:protein-tyrosine-phosphatase